MTAISWDDSGVDLGNAHVEAELVLHAAWLACPNPVVVEELRSAVPVPGNVALRTRYEAILASTRSGLTSAAFQVPRELWLAQLSRAVEGDELLSANRPDLARAAYNLLASLHVVGLHPQPLIDAETGLGDAARQADDIGAAIDHYQRASRLAGHIEHRYAQVRVAIPLGYLLMRVGSSARAARQFIMASEYANLGDWRLDEANALLGLGEAYARLRQPEKAHEPFRRALQLYDGLRSEPGRANTFLQIAETSRRFGHPEDAREAYVQSLVAAGAGSVAAVNALDGLAEVEVVLGEPAAAYDHFLEALTTSGPGYPRGAAHALNGLGGLFFDELEWATASDFYRAAAEAYEQLNDLVSAASSHGGLAACAERSADVDTQLAERLVAVACIERHRAAQIVHADQGEYFQRFGQFHELALADGLLHGRLDVFIQVFEAVTGRRLSGLAHRTTPVAIKSRFSAQLAARGSRVFPRVTGIDPFVDSMLRLGSDVLGSTLQGMAGNNLDRELAQAFVPFNEVDPGHLWDIIQRRNEPVLMLVLLRRLETVAWLLIDPTDPVPKFGLHGISSDCLAIVEQLDREGLALDATPDSLEALHELLPPPVLDHLPDDARVTLVPADELWAVPWSAVRHPDGRFMGEVFAVRRAPSLEMLSIDPLPDAPASVTWWRSPLVTHHQLPSLRGSSGKVIVRPLADATQARQAVLRSGEHDLVVIVAHGHPVEGLIHFIELGAGTRLVPVDLLDAQPPQLLALISCWGATGPGRVPGDPLSVATLALARGCAAVAATTSELRDDVPSSSFVNFFLDAALRLPMPEALQEATRRWLRRDEYRCGYLSRWAPLTVLTR